MSITIRYATLADAEAIAKLSRQTFYDTFAQFNSKEDMDKFMTESFSMEKLMAEVGMPEYIFLVAMLNNDLAGYAKLSNSKNPEALHGISAIEISRIYAAKHTIGLGIGKTLMEKCIGIAKEQNKEVIWLGVWEENERAINFYKKFGFEKFGEHDFVLGNDVQTDWLMKREI